MGLTFQKKTRDIYRSVLSDVSLGIIPKYVPVKDRTIGTYTRKGQKVVKMKWPRLKRYPRFDLVVDPILKWFPSRMSYFIFHKLVKRDIGVMVNDIPRPFNASGWISNHDKCYALAVPKDRAVELKEWLYNDGYWLDTKCNRWKRFFNHNKKHILRRKANASIRVRETEER